MYILIILAICYVLHPVYSEDICDRVNIRYFIGRTTPILNILAEEISQMHASCYKEVIIPGANRIQLRVQEADFGFNKAYIYNGLIGTGQTPVYDKIEIYVGNCSTFTKKVEVKRGLQVEFHSEILCLHIQPEVKYKTLGAHIPGGRIRIDVRVDIAICQALTHLDERTCQPLCTKYGKLHNCQRDSGSTMPSTISTLQSSTMQTSVTKATSYFTTIVDNTPSSTDTAYLTTVSTTTLSAVKTSSSQGATSTESIQYPTSQTLLTKVINKLTSTNPTYSTQSGQNETLPPVTASSHKMVTKYRFETGTLSTSAVVTTQSRDNNSQAGHGKQNFGLLEGLYVIASCIVILLLFGIIAFLVRKRRKHDSSNGSNSAAAFRTGLRWRDNWLIRYHNNEIDGDSFSQPESEIQYVHTNYLNQSSADSQFLDQSEYPQVIKHKLSDDLYDNPWPLVRLDSEFVRNTKKVEGGKENIEIIRNLDSEQNRSDNDDESSCGYEYGNENLATETPHLNSVQKKIETNNENDRHHKHNFTKHFCPPMSSKGKYNVEKVERSNSTRNNFIKEQTINEIKSYFNHVEKDRSKSESYLNRPENNKKRRTSQRSSSSMHSGHSSTFEEMMRDEIKIIEDAMDMKDNGDIESDGIDRKYRNDIRRNWKVNTLYAVVSSRNKIPSQDVLIARKPLHKLQVDGINRSESYKMIDTNNISHCNETKDMRQKRSNSSQKSCNIKEQMQESSLSLEDIQPTANKDRTHNTYTKTIDCNVKCNEDNPTFESANENYSDSRGQLVDIQSDHSGVENTHLSRNMFLENRQRFEDNGSIMQNNNGATGTGQFPK